ncbi:hypothetical protein OIU78_024643 [Salix suchowensis]|nr:hypothetical protein OIU78_024643 [Salix suchowensis]
MGNFYSAARDPIFFSHHSNVDRMWSVWKTLGGRRTDLTDPDWLNASFFFYDENANPVRVTVKDCLDSRNLGYVYQDVEIPWLQIQANTEKVARPKKSRSRKQKEEEEELLVIKGVEFDKTKALKFDVYINDEDDSLSAPDKTEFAGSFVNVPHKHKHGKKMSTCFKLALTDLLEDLEAEDDDSVIVTLVPRYGEGLAKIGGIKIEFDRD